MEKEFDFEVGDVIRLRNGKIGLVEHIFLSGDFQVLLSVENSKPSAFTVSKAGKNYVSGDSHLDVMEIVKKANQTSPEPKQRKIVQITSCFHEQCPITTALCDDGTLWQIGYFNKGWDKYPEIPQD